MLPQQASGAEDRPAAGTADPGPRAASDETHSSGPELSCRSTDFGLGRGQYRGTSGSISRDQASMPPARLWTDSKPLPRRNRATRRLRTP